MHNTDQEQRNMVKPQLQMISIVPLPFGGEVHPCLASTSVTLLVGELVLSIVGDSGVEETRTHKRRDTRNVRRNAIANYRAFVIHHVHSMEEVHLYYCEFYNP